MPLYTINIILLIISGLFVLACLVVFKNEHSFAWFRTFAYIYRTIFRTDMAKKRSHILIIDDDSDVLISTKLFLKRHYSDIDVTDNPRDINSLLSGNKYDVVLLDMNFRKGEDSGKEGLYWLNHIKSISPDTGVIMITAYGSIDLAVEAVQKGAADFILKPWEGKKVLEVIDKILSGRKKISNSDDGNKPVIVGESEAIKKLLDDIKRVAITDANVLILGENGTGKQLVANLIHYYSSRKGNDFITVDLGSLNDNIFESELYGHVKGAFTSAISDKVGRFEMADKGTLFLDEIGNVPVQQQAKLLTSIQNKVVNKVGDDKTSSVDVRIISATNGNLHDMVQSGEFREDLLYRINTIELLVPPLRERQDDIPLLINYFINKYTLEYGKEGLEIDPKTVDIMCRYPWPGNIRELEHAIERMVIMTDGVSIMPDDFQLKSKSQAGADMSAPDTLNLEEMEKLCVIKALDKHKGNISKAAEELGLTRAALYRRISKYEI